MAAGVLAASFAGGAFSHWILLPDEASAQGYRYVGITGGHVTPAEYRDMIRYKIAAFRNANATSIRIAKENGNKEELATLERDAQQIPEKAAEVVQRNFLIFLSPEQYAAIKGKTFNTFGDVVKLLAAAGLPTDTFPKDIDEARVATQEQYLAGVKHREEQHQATMARAQEAKEYLEKNGPGVAQPAGRLEQRNAEQTIKVKELVAEQITLADAAGNVRGQLSIDKKGDGMLVLAGKKDIYLMSMVDQDGHPAMYLSNPSGQGAVVMCAQPAIGQIVLQSAKGAIVFEALRGQNGSYFRETKPKQ